MLIIGVGVGVYISHHYKLDWRLWWTGAFTFFISQVLHIPFNYFFLNPKISTWTGILPEVWHLPLMAILLGISAGIFEELTRYFVYRWWAKDARSWSQGLLFGAGHGGLEAILVGGLTLYTYIQIMALKGVDLATIVPLDQLTMVKQQIELYWSLPWYDSLMGALERLLAMPLHLAASLLVLQAILRKRFSWVWLAIGLHTLTNAVGVYLAQTVNVYAAEAGIGIFAIIDMGIILLLRRTTAISPVQLPIIQQSPWTTRPLQEIRETQENLEQTRYQ